MSFWVIIPARYGSSRLPGKPLLPLGGKTMIEQVWLRARRSGAERVIIATDDARIEQVALEFGAEVCMTRTDHQSGSERLAEVIERYRIDPDLCIVNVQGDEPLIPEAIIAQVAGLLVKDTKCSMASLYTPIETEQQLRDPNVVKVVTNAQQQALYFSRAPIPWLRDAAPGSWLEQGQFFRHIGLYAYRAGFLTQYLSLAPSPLEDYEKLEQLRVLAHGYRIAMAPAEILPAAGIDTLEDYQRVQKQLG